MRRALIVEDDPDIVELLTHYLQGDGWTVAVAGDGRSALERLKKEAFDLLMLDLQIPALDGLAVCAAVRALFRRLERQGGSPPRLEFGDLRIDRERHTAQWAGQPVQLTAKEFALLVALVEAHGRVLSRQHLLEQVWGYSYAEGTRTVDVHVRRLREKLPGLAPSILTVKSLGYRVAAEAD